HNRLRRRGYGTRRSDVCAVPIRIRDDRSGLYRGLIETGEQGTCPLPILHANGRTRSIRQRSGHAAVDELHVVAAFEQDGLERDVGTLVVALIIENTEVRPFNDELPVWR